MRLVCLWARAVNGAVPVVLAGAEFKRTADKLVTIPRCRLRAPRASHVQKSARALLRRTAMTQQFPAAVSVCSEYQRLLEESTGAREACSTCRTEKCEGHVISEEAIGELLRLEAEFARAYALLRNHVHTCGRCGPVSRAA